MPMKKYNWAQWEPTSSRSYFAGEVCGVCAKEATHIAIAEDEDNADCIRARCDEHWNKDTQKKWLKAWREKNTV